MLVAIMLIQLIVTIVVGVYFFGQLRRQGRETGCARTRGSSVRELEHLAQRTGVFAHLPQRLGQRQTAAQRVAVGRYVAYHAYVFVAFNPFGQLSGRIILRIQKVLRHPFSPLHLSIWSYGWHIPCWCPARKSARAYTADRRDGRVRGAKSPRRS